MKHLRWLIPLLLILLCAGPLSAQTYNPVSGWCEDGNKSVVTSGLTSTTKVQASYPLCTVSVIVHGGGAATIYSDTTGTPLANPFTASANGRWIFFAASGIYDVTLTGGTPALPAPVVLTSLLSGVGAGAVTSFSSGNLSPLFTTSVATATTTPALSFSLSNAAANTVFGRCTGTLGAPSFCSLTSGMIPAPGSNTQVIFNSSGAFAASQDMVWNDSTKVFAIGTGGNPAVSLLVTGGAARIAFAAGLPRITDNTGSGWNFVSQNSQDINFGPTSDPLSYILGGDASEAHGVIRAGIGANNGVLKLNDGSSGAGTFLGPLVIADVGSPEGAVTASVGSLALRTDGVAGTTLYTKATGSGNTGWLPYACIAGSNCTASIFYAGNGVVGAPSYSFTSDTDTGLFFTGTQVTMSLNGASQFSTNGGPGITSSGTVCMTTTTRCLSSGTASTSLDPYVRVSGGAILFGVPLVAGDVTTTGWGNTERGGFYFNTSTNRARFWNGSALESVGSDTVYSCGTSAACSPTIRPNPLTYIGSAALDNASPSKVTISAISPAFTSNATYKCVVSDETAVLADVPKITYVSGSSFTITTATNTITDVVGYVCTGY